MPIRRPCATPTPVVYLVPGVGMLTFAKDKATARIAAEFYVNAINVMRGASGVGSYVGLAEQEAFNIEYWLLEEAKLQRMPKPKSLAGRDRAGHRRRRRHRQGDRGAAAWARAPASCSPTSTRQASMRRVADFGKRFGKDAVARRPGRRDRARPRSRPRFHEAAARVRRHRHRRLQRRHRLGGGVRGHLARTLEPQHRRSSPTGYFLAARGGYRLMKEQGLGGAIVFIASKNALAASPGASAYCAAKAAEVHLARCLALEGAPFGIRVNTVNPDAVLRGSKIWQGEWRPAARGVEQGERGRARGGLPPALAAEALGVPRGHRRGGLLSSPPICPPRSPANPQRRRRQRGELHPLSRANS